MNFININKKKIFQGKLVQFSSESGQGNPAQSLVSEGNYWISKKNDRPGSDFFIIDYQKEITIDYVQLLPSPNGPKTFPENFRIEYSLDGKTWNVIHTERGYTPDADSYIINFPYTTVRFIKVFILKTNNVNAQYYVELAQCVCGISGFKSITASSKSIPENSARNMTDGNNITYWESQISDKSTAEHVLIDIGKIVPVTHIILSSADDRFPRDFSIETSTDEEIWTPLLDEKNFHSQPMQDYFWLTNCISARYVRFISKSVNSDSSNTFSLRIANFNIAVLPVHGSQRTLSPESLPYASIFQAGIVKLAKDGEDLLGTAVQGNDRRLRDASTIFKGIMQFAEDGEDKEGLGVQASDSRLKNATELNPGIVRLAYDRENNPGCVVQGNDSRLLEATDDNYGIVKTCPDGLYTEFGVVRGNDSRLQKATPESYGISRLAKNGETSSGAVVQADDNRLRDATTFYKGIVELADNGEDREGVAVQGHDKRLRDATTSSKGIVELADSGEDRPGVAVQGNDIRLKDATTTTRGVVELAEDGEEKPGTAVQANDKRLKDASVESKGIVRLAGNGEDTANTAVQGNDRRLKNATTASGGIVRLAGDGGEDEGTVVQGNDKRLRDATTLTRGIVQLAENGSDREGTAVQANDNRLREATTDSKGITELAEDKEEKAGAVVQSNDSRLKDATERTKGIVRFAANGANDANAAVQGNDRRLRDATTTAKGIVELAEDGEETPGVVVQGNDKRLKKATTTAQGIVELAENGENRPGVAVQGNDKRLLEATENHKGIVQLAANRETRGGLAVQANDERLSDSRTPLPHDHNYATKDHDFNSHSGTLYIKSKKSEHFKEIVPPSDNSSIIQATNDSKKTGSIGLSGIAGTTTDKQINAYGVVGHSSHIGMRGQSTGNQGIKGCGVLGISRFGAGGVFSSEHDYSVVIDGYGTIENYENNVTLKGNGDALQVKGKSRFNGTIEISNEGPAAGNAGPANIVEYFEVDETEYIAAGDLLVIKESGNSVLVRSRSPYNKAVIGPVAANPVFQINNSGTGTKVYPVTLTGKALCKVDAREKPVRAGDLIVTSPTPGCGMPGTIDSFDKIGTVIGKALDSLDEGIGVIPVFICHQ